MCLFVCLLQLGVVSWQEFVHQMLAKGEVQQIIVSPDAGTANVILYENAVLNGKPVSIDLLP